MTDLLLRSNYIELYQGETFKFEVAPGTLSGGFNAGTDTVRFIAKRSFKDTVTLLDIAGVIMNATTARITVPVASTASFGSWPVEMHWSVVVTRAAEEFVLLAGELRVYPSAKES